MKPRKLGARRYEYRGYTLRRLRHSHEVVPRGKFSGRWVTAWKWFVLPPGAEEPADDAQPFHTLGNAARAVDNLVTKQRT